jgi:hypothetical protein
MLSQKLLGASAPPTRFIGAAGAPAETTGSSSISVSLSGLGVQVGDFVILAAAVRGTGNLTFSATSGYIAVADLFISSSTNTNLGVFYKRLTAVDATATVSYGSTTNSAIAFVYVWRGINVATPLAGTTTTATAVDSARPDAPSITTTASNAIVIAIGAGAGPLFSVSPLTAPSGMTNFANYRLTSTLAVGVASVVVPAAGAYDPASFGGGGVVAGQSYCAVTMALRRA